SAALYAGGVTMLKSSGKTAFALLLQTIPFYSEITYDIIGRLVPELLMPLPGLLLSLVMIKMVTCEEKQITGKIILLLAAITAFGLSIKMSWLPLAVIPLFIIPGWKLKLRYILLTFTAFLIFALPATLEYKNFYLWIKGLFLHSGNYGSGDANFLDPDLFLRNFKTIIQTTPSLFYCLALLSLSAIIYLTFRNKEKNSNRILWLTAGVITAILLHLALASKHYSYRYLIPTLTLIPATAMLSFEMLHRVSPILWNSRIVLLLTLLLFIPGVKKQVTSAQIRSKGIGEEMAGKRETWYQAQALPDSCIKIIASQGYGAPFQDYVIIYSTAWGGPRMKDYRETLSRLYPDTYHYSTWDKQVKTFGLPFVAAEVAKSEKKVFVYLEKDSPELMLETLNSLIPASDSLSRETKLIYHNPKTEEALYQLQLGKIENPD
ncbi:MAG TPA: hypothetical protein PKJ24_10340, partial [Prolixibacteraceae bacterium]|nr:hypothetical protein [Prolixibacteraceae bacterium]